MAITPEEKRLLDATKRMRAAKAAFDVADTELTNACKEYHEAKSGTETAVRDYDARITR